MWRPRPTRRHRTILLALLGATLVALALPALSGCKKKKLVTLSKKECDRFCKRLVPCFAEVMPDPMADQSAELARCLRDCRTKDEVKTHQPIVRAMKRCGGIKDCAKLRACFTGSKE